MKKDPKRVAFNYQRNSAKARGIQFLFTFEQWCAVWDASGQWVKRGRKIGQYVMARKGDRGAYEIGNVDIVTTSTNMAAAGAHALGRKQSVSHKRKRLAGLKQHWDSLKGKARQKRLSHLKQYKGD